MTLGELLMRVQAGKSFSCEPRPAKPDEWGVIKVSAMTWGTFDENENKAVPDGKAVDPRNEIRSGDILLSRSNTERLVGASVLVGSCRSKLLLSDKSIRLVASQHVSAPWLQRMLSSSLVRDQISDVATGTSDSMRNVSQDKLLAVHLNLPPQQEQKRIVSKIDELFSEIEEGERALEKVRTLVERYRQSVLKAAVTGELTRHWREKHKDELESGEALLARILKARREAWENAELAKMKAKGRKPAGAVWKSKYREPQPPQAGDNAILPLTWASARLEQLGFVESGGTPPGIEAKLRSEEDIPWCKVSSMNDDGNDRVLRSSKWYLSKEDTLSLGLKTFRPGAIVFPKRGGAILTNKKRILGVRASLDLNMMCFSPIEGLGGFIWTLFSNFDLKRLYDGSNVPQINHPDIANIVVGLPPEQECSEIASRVEQHMSVVDAVSIEIDRRLDHCKALRQAVLKSAFTGKLVTQDPTDEPTSVLLERIAAERATASSNKKKPASKPQSANKKAKA